MNLKLFTSLLLASLFALTSCSKRIAPSDGLVGEYLFKGNAKDNSSYHNNGEVHGAVLVAGHNKKSEQSAYQFNGVDQFITIPNKSQNNFTYGQNFSISLWVSVAPTQKDVGSTLNDVMRKWRGDTQGYPFAFVYYNHTAPDSMQNRFSFVRYDGSVCRNSPQLFSTPAKNGEGFTHIVLIKDHEWIKIYQDGKLAMKTKDTVMSESECGSHNNNEITIGTRGNKVRFFNGVIDDVRMYNRALTEEEIEMLFKL